MPKLEAVVVPTRVDELALILRNLSLWSAEQFLPSTTPSSPKPALHFVFNNAAAEAHESEIRERYVDSEMDRFFERLRFTYLELQGLDDLYSRSAKGPVGPGGYKAGPNNQFFGSMALYNNAQGPIFFMETDCIPIRAGWLDAVSDRVKYNASAYVIGSAYRGSAALTTSIFRHVNGNAIYCVDQSGFPAFLEDWKQWLASLIASGSNNMAYDVLVETVFSMAPDNEEARKFFQKYLPRVQYTDVVQNISSADDKYLVEPHLVRSILSEFPETYVVHGALFSTAADRLLDGDDELRPENLVIETAEGRVFNNSKITAMKRSTTKKIRAFADWVDDNELKYAIFGLRNRSRD